MDIHSFGRELADVLAQRSLDILRHTTASDVRSVVSGRFLRPASSSMSVAATAVAVVVGAAIGAGVAVLVTPLSGPELRKRVARSTRSARLRAMELGESVASQVEEAGHALIENASNAIGSAAPAAQKPKSRANGRAHATHDGQAKRPTRHAHA